MKIRLDELEECLNQARRLHGADDHTLVKVTTRSHTEYEHCNMVLDRVTNVLTVIGDR